MPIAVIKWSQTPNPHAKKLTLSPAPGVSVRSARSAAEAAGDPLTARLFAVPGVVGLYFGPGWLTVSKAAEASWPAVQAGVEGVLGSES